MKEVYAISDVGTVRQTNEDNFLVDKEHSLYVVADGMGGHVGGEIASALLIKSVQEFIEQSPYIDQKVLQEALLFGNHIIYESGLKQDTCYGMGTTGVLLYIKDGRAYFAHVGDSRLYLFRNSELKQLTKDHSLVEELVEEGKISREEARQHPKKNILLRAIGTEPNVEVDTNEIQIEKNDIFLLCSDGLIDGMSDKEIETILSSYKGDEDISKKLIEQAIKGGSRDNITSLVLIC